MEIKRETNIWINGKRHLIQKRQTNNIYLNNTAIYNIEINNKIISISIEKKDKQNIYLKIDNKIYKAKILTQTDDLLKLFIHNLNKSFEIELKKQNKIKPAKLANKNNFKETLKSPLAGKVLSIKAKQGSKIQKGELLLTIESMKMENEIKASSNCFIKTIQIATNDLVKENQLLMTFDKKGESSCVTKNKNGSKQIPNRRTC